MPIFKRDLSEANQEIIKKSVNFETAQITMVKRSERLAWWVAACSLVVTIALVGAIVYMLPLKEKVPYLVTVDLKRSTSTISHLRDNVAMTGIYASEALNRSHVARFVQAREGYDWDTIQEHEWEFVAAMSNDRVKQLFVKQFDGTPNSPDKRWGRDKAIRVKVNSIVFHGLNEEQRIRPTGATVRFEKWQFDKRSGVSKYMSSHVATMHYEYKTNLRMNENLRLRNPLGFQVTTYKVDDEFNAPTFKREEMTGGVPLIEESDGQLNRGEGSDISSSTDEASGQPDLPGAAPTPSTR
ncbi:type IV secretion system protein [Hydrogenophaga sp. 5NK40-0174]|uniref:virB8 family protein n=1 Tax=Hydrogenophaga sp. 5NK40-0174 TaxID=3127649 RepID=UPI003108F868